MSANSQPRTSLLDRAHRVLPGGTFGNTPADIIIHKALLEADIDPTPDEEMLEGGLAEGSICGAVDWVELSDMLALELDLEPTEQAALALYLQTIADIECEDTDCEQISVGLFFSAVSAIVTEP